MLYVVVVVIIFKIVFFFFEIGIEMKWNAMHNGNADCRVF